MTRGGDVGIGENAPHVGGGIFVARWSGECAWCTQGIRPGDLIRPGREGLEEGWRHEDCTEVEDHRERVARARRTLADETPSRMVMAQALRIENRRRQKG